jgi:hypothetical protein
MSSAFHKLRRNRRVETVDDERGIGNGLIVTLAKGWALDPLVGCHVFGEDTPEKALETTLRAQRCRCKECKPS